MSVPWWPGPKEKQLIKDGKLDEYYDLAVHDVEEGTYPILVGREEATDNIKLSPWKANRKGES